MTALQPQPAQDRIRVDRRFDAVVFDWDEIAIPDRSADADEVRRRIERLCALGMHVAVVSGTNFGNVDGQLGARPAGPGTLHLLLNRGSEVYRVGADGAELLHRRAPSPEEDRALTRAAELTCRRLGERGLDAKVVSDRRGRRKIELIPERLHDVVEVAQTAAADAGLRDARVTSDAKHVEIGQTDKSESARWILAELWRRGVGPGLVLVVGGELAGSVGVEPEGVPPELHQGGGPDAVAALLDDQIRRRKERAVPELDGQPAWTLAIDGIDPTLERAHESILTLADGCVGTAGSPLGRHPAASPRVLAGGVYVGTGPESELISCPLWNPLPFAIGEAPIRRTLDLHAGLLRHEIDAEQGDLRALAFASPARPGTAALRATGPAAILRKARALAAPGDRDWRHGTDAGRHWLAARAGRGGVVSAASQAWCDDSEGLDRLAVYCTSSDHEPSPEEALARLRAAERAGYESLLVEHREAWARRWEEADVRIEGDEELQRAVRFALFQLMGSVPDDGEAAVGARGLSGGAYRGHVFWDACIFVLPFLAATHPRSARAMLEYRIRRLPAALAAARAAGRRGARFPWESAADGHDVTPGSAFSRAGERLPVLTGALAEHIVADVAWAVAHYVDWTGDSDFLLGSGGRLLVETARYWASRVERDGEGLAHIRDVMGPDEYHAHVDDNAFTNVMARWNLRRAAMLEGDGPAGVSDSERTEWLEVAGSLVDGYDPTTRFYEQFAGFDELEPLVIAEVAPRRPIAADLLLGRSRVESAQVVKQADVLMLHHLVPAEVAPGSLRPNLDFYEPRTAHASSLSPGIHAALLARAGGLDEACEALRLTARIDLDDISETTAGGLHLAAMGSVWQALAFGFAGLRPAGDALRIDPRLPRGWRALELRVRFLGAGVRLRIDAEQVHVVAERTIRIALADAAPVEIGPAGARLTGPAAPAGGEGS